MIERHVIGISEKDYADLQAKSKLDVKLNWALSKVKNRSRRSVGVLVIENDMTGRSLQGEPGSLEYARQARELVIKEYRLPADKVGVYLERISMELVI